MKRRTVVITAVFLTTVLAGCTPTGPPGSATAPSGATTASGTTSAAALEAGGVPGYAIGEFPPVPLFVMPDLSMLDSSLGGFSIKVRDSFPSVKGVTIRAVKCDSSGAVQTDTGTLQFYGNGSGSYTGPDGTIHNYGDGSGSFSLNGKTVHVYGDGSGDYTNGKVTIHSYGDGSGDYTDGTTTIHLYGDGSGDYTNGQITIHNYGDGSGDYTDGTVTIHNYGNGSGDYTDGTVTIHNYGDASGDFFNSTTAEKRQIAPAAIPQTQKLGQFPQMGTLKPIKSCGTRIVIEDSVMFDFGKDSLRSEAQSTITNLAKVLNELKVHKATISGHTDSIGSDSSNQDLSERRAKSVLNALLAKQVSATLDAKGYGETKPIAPNQIDGKDNPAGRQLNRRVEIFIPEG
jgi:OmpA-OmpF porin, OOP family